MTIDELTSLINELSEVSNISQADIIDSIAKSAKLKFGKITSNDERKIIDNIKSRLVLGLYDMPNHSYVTSKPDYKEKFGFDDFDMKYLSKAGEELDDEKLIDGNSNYTQLTENGILYAKKMNGDI